MSVRIASVPAPGAAPVITLGPAPAPPGPGEVTLSMRAAALNFADLLMAEGRYQEQPAFPFTPALEGMGVVTAAGPGVLLAPGTRVAVAAQGCLAEAVTVPAARVLAIPDALGDLQAAGFQVAYGTSHLALARAGLRAGETLAVLGAGGGVGLTAVEIGAAMGARVLAVARGAVKAEAARAAGAAAVLDPEAGDLKAMLRAEGGVDVVYDALGGAPGLAAFGALRPGGRHLVIGFAAGAPPALPLNHALVKNLTILGFYWGGMRKLDPEALTASLEALLAMVEAGTLRPSAPASLPLDRLPEAYATLRRGGVVGKLVITL